MPVNSLVLIGSDPEVFHWAPVEEVLSGWTGMDRSRLVRVTAEQALEQPQLLDGCRAVWYVVREVQASSFHDLLGRLQERVIPVMLTRLEDPGTAGAAFEAGVVLGPVSAGADVLGAVLRTLWEQTAVTQSLLAEVQLLKVQQGGLCGQIDKIDEEMRIAAQIQREFLPNDLPSHRDVGFRVLYRPAGYVSGDIYDVTQLDDHHIGFFLADAVGHGVPAALFTMYIKHALRTKQTRADDSPGSQIVEPGEVLARLNNDLLHQPATKMRFPSACYGTINCQTLEVAFARAGHPFPLMLRADGTQGFLEPEGTLLGIFPDKPFETVRLSLSPGDRMLLYSDGFESAFPQADGSDGATGTAVMDPLNQQYIQELADLANGPTDEAMKRLAMKLDQQAGSLNQKDDLTVVCLEVSPDACPASDDAPPPMLYSAAATSAA